MVKEWHQDIREHIDEWTNKLEHSYWPQFVYHFTDIKNAVGIIGREAVLSRKAADKEELVENENADVEVIGNTVESHKEFARFYYAPRTPTQFCNEGIKPAGEQDQAHCPIPVFFAFDAFSFLTADQTMYSDGNMATGYVSYGAAQEDFSRIPFEMVFHRTYFSRDERDEIIFHRHAEALVPDEAPFSLGLRWIGCRSNAEMVMLKTLLGQDLAEKYDNFIRVADSSFFVKKQIFVSDVSIKNQELRFSFNKNAQHIVKIDSLLTVTRPDGKNASFKNNITCKNDYVLHLREEYQYIDVELVLDSILAFKGRVYHSAIV